MGIHQYEFARLNAGQIERLKQLEQQFGQENGGPVTLIAFTQRDEYPETDCRPAIDD